VSKLAINGGPKVRETYFPPQRTIGNEERAAVMVAMESHSLSHFRANLGPNFRGGPIIQAAEKAFGEMFGGTAISVNSCTSGLWAACAAIGLEPGDEVIVTPWSMSCSATMPILFGAKPVFADIESDYFCLDAESVRSKITDKTKAIIVVDLFGQPYSEEIDRIAVEHGLHVIEDAAQAIGSTRDNKFAGSLGGYGTFSFTQGKHLTSGEGGMVLIKGRSMGIKSARNHSECIRAEYLDIKNPFMKNDVGLNLRMTEPQAAIVIEQLKKLPDFIKYRQENVAKLNDKLSQIPAITPAKVRPGCTHTYYVAAYHFDTQCNISRDSFIDAVKAELMGDSERVDRGVPLNSGYITPLYKFPTFSDPTHWAIRNQNYNIALPNVERLQDQELFITLFHGLDLQDSDIDDIANAFFKVWENREEINVYEIK